MNTIECSFNMIHISDLILTSDETYKPGIILWMHLANKRRRYNVTSSLIG